MTLTVRPISGQSELRNCDSHRFRRPNGDCHRFRPPSVRLREEL